MSRPRLQSRTSRALSWIQCKLGKQHLVKKVTLPWELNPGPHPVFPTRPSLNGRARLDRRLGEIARLMPVFLWFCPSICDFGHIHKRCWAVWQTGQQRFQRALIHKKTTKSLKPEFRPSLRPSNARIFVQKAPVFRPSFYKNGPVWRIGNTALV